MQTFYSCWVLNFGSITPALINGRRHSGYMFNFTDCPFRNVKKIGIVEVEFNTFEINVCKAKHERPTGLNNYELKNQSTFVNLMLPNNSSKMVMWNGLPAEFVGS